MCESLEQLQSDCGFDLERQIELLNEKIAEDEERSHYLGRGSGYSRARTPAGLDLVTDDEVREIFRTLRD